MYTRHRLCTASSIYGTACSRCRRAQKRFRERQKVKQQEAVQRVVQLEEALDRLEVERSELSQRLQAMASGRGGGGDGPLATPPKAEDSGSEVREPESSESPANGPLHRLPRCMRTRKAHPQSGCSASALAMGCDAFRRCACVMYDAWWALTVVACLLRSSRWCRRRRRARSGC